MHRFISPFAAALFVILVGTLVGGCERPVESCKEFDPPPGKEPTACPPKPAAAVQAQPALPARYCYSSLGQVDCYSEPQPGRTGYLGSTEAPPPPVAAAAAPAKGKKGAAAATQTQGASTTPAAASTTTSTTTVSTTPAPAASAASTGPTPLKPTPAN
jgi:hypothetical protein